MHCSAKCQGECIKRSYSDRAGYIAIQMTIKGKHETTIHSMLYSRHHNVAVPLCWGLVPFLEDQNPPCQEPVPSVRDHYN